MIMTVGKRLLACLAAALLLSGCGTTVSDNEKEQSDAAESIVINEESSAESDLTGDKATSTEPVVMIEQKADSIADVYGCSYTIV